MTEANKLGFENRSDCHVCGLKIRDKSDKVREHNHITKAYRGPAHKKCNDLLRLTKKVPIFFHNLKGYDSKFILQNMGEFVDDNENINIIATSSEKLLQIYFNYRFHFVDSLNFLSASLDNLVSGCSKFNYINEISSSDLLRKKLAYPYEYMSIYRFI